MNNNYAITSISKDEEQGNFIVFKLKEKLYAINIQNVIEIINLPQIEIPQATPKGIVGIFNYNGVMIKVVDLCPFLGFETPNFSANNQLIIATIEGVYFAIYAENIVSISSFEYSDVQHLPYNTDNSIIKEVYKAENESINIVDVNKIDKFIAQNIQESTVDYSSLFPQDEKQKEILKHRAEQNKVTQELFAFPVNLTSINQYILFVLDNQNYFLDLKHVKEFVSLKRLNITKLPYTQSYIKGIINLKGDFLVVLDLKRFLNNDKNNENEGSKLIIVESQNFNIALLVDDIKFIRNLENLKSEEFNVNNACPYISAEFMEEGELYNILNFEKIINDERLYINIK